MRKAIFIFLSVMCCSGVFAQTYQSDWESLSTHQASPKWFRDAKFGIYFHWGPYSVPAYGNEHYPRTLYGHPSGKKPVEDTNKRNHNLGVGFQTYREHEFHNKTFGKPQNFEYHDLIPLFVASHFDAQEWADLFFLSGAKFAGPVAEHHDGYAMWDSELTPWNAMDTGPMRDVVGEMAQAIRKHDMKFITTFHHAKNGRSVDTAESPRWWHYHGREKYWQRVNSDYSDNSELQMLYGNMPTESWLKMWNGKLEEVIDQYQPDMIWFDSWLDKIPETNRQQFAAYYLNAAQKWNKEVMITYKQEDMPQSVGVVDFEKGRLDKLTDFSWLTDDTISAGSWTTTGSWSYTEELDIKSSKELVHTLIDIVSKNGQLLLNVSPTADGLIPQEQRESLLGVGQWLLANGEAIYATRPFVSYGEGPKRLKSSGHFVEMDGEYNHENIRFTTSGSTLYAIQMGWPGSNKPILIKSLADALLPGLEITDVSVVGSPDEIQWHKGEQGLLLTSPSEAPNKIAIIYKIETNGHF
ncbi:MAG: alpha-L-fucosidase [Pseudomonadales bacterium]